MLRSLTCICPVSFHYYFSIVIVKCCLYNRIVLLELVSESTEQPSPWVSNHQEFKVILQLIIYFMRRHFMKIFKSSQSQKIFVVYKSRWTAILLFCKIRFQILVMVSLTKRNNSEIRAAEDISSDGRYLIFLKYKPYQVIHSLFLNTTIIYEFFETIKNRSFDWVNACFLFFFFSCVI